MKTKVAQLPARRIERTNVKRKDGVWCRGDGIKQYHERGISEGYIYVLEGKLKTAP